MEKRNIIAISIAIMAASPTAMALVVPVPEPDILSLFGAGAIGLILAERWRRNRKK